jgi:hypothetical protein
MDKQPFGDEVEFSQKLNLYSAEFDRQTLYRHEQGAEKYGPLKFLGVDTIQEAIEEVLDLSNYMRYTYVKLRLLQEALAEKVTMEFGSDKIPTLGEKSFRRSGQ